MYKHKRSHARKPYIYTLCFYYRGHVVNSGAPILQWEDDSNPKTTYERPHMLTAQNASVAQTTVGINDYICTKITKTHNVLDMLILLFYIHIQQSYSPLEIALRARERSEQRTTVVFACRFA